MVAVPTTPGRSVQVQQGPGGGLRYSPGRDYMSGALVQAGRALEGAARDFDTIEATYDEADALRITNEFLQYERERLRTGESAYLTTQGFAAGDGREGAVGDLRQSSENLLQGARSGRARAMAQRALAARLDSAETSIANHAVSEMRAARTAQRKAQQASALTDAVDARGTDQFAVHLGVAEMALEQTAIEEGWSSEQLAAARDDLVSGAHSQVVLAIDSEDGEPTAALAYLDANKDLIGPDQERQLRNALTPRVDAAFADQIVRSADFLSLIPAAEPVALPADATPAQGGATDGAMAMLRQSEGFREGTYWDVNHHRLGYGSDTITTASGQVRTVRRGDRVSREDAERDLARRAGDLERSAAQRSGDGWNALSSGAQAAIISVAYNYGEAHSRLEPLWSAAARGDSNAVAETIASFAGDNGGINRGRRMDEAEAARSGAVAGAPGVPADPRLSSAAMRAAVDAYIERNPVSEARKLALYAAADRAVAEGRAERAQAEQDADRRVTDWLVQNRPGQDDFTDVAQIPASVIAGASPSLRSQLQQQAAATRDRIQARENRAAAERVTQTERVAKIELAQLSDEELARVNLDRYQGRADPLYLAQMRRRQKSIVAGGDAYVKRDTITTIADGVAKVVGIDREKEPAEFAQIIASVERETAGMDPKSLDRTGRAGIIGMLSEKVTTDDGWIWDSTAYRYQLEQGQTYSRRGDPIPPGARAKLDRMLPDASENRKFREFQRARSMGLSWAFK